MTPTARSLKHLRDRGWIACVVQQRLHMPNAPFPITRDAFGFGDILAASTRMPYTMLVQATGGQGGNLMARVHKIIDRDPAHPEINRNAIIWILAGNYIVCHGWAKRKPRGTKRERWTLKIKQIIPEWKDGQKSPKSPDDWKLAWCDLDESNFLDAMD